MTVARLGKNISLFALVMLITGSIDSIRNLPPTALFGSSLVFFFLLASVVFLLPVALISAQLAAQFPKHNGIYDWVKHALGVKLAVVTIWLQWVNTLVWYPTILAFIAGTLSYLIDPQLAQSKYYLVSVVLVSFWLLTWLNLKGFQTSARFASVCTVVGMVIPMAFIMLLACVWLFTGHASQLHLSWAKLIPSLHHFDSWISLTAIITAFLGLELASVHVKSVPNPQKVFPQALGYSTLLILATMILGAFAIAIVLPAGQIHLVDGVMQAFTAFLTVYHLAWMTPFLAIMLVVGSLGGMINWIISPAKGLLLAAEDGYLPAFFAHQNSHQVASRVLVTQAVLVSFVCLGFTLMPSVNGVYWLLTDLSTQLYVFMYVFMFAAAFVLQQKVSHDNTRFKIPAGKIGTYFVCSLGVIGCVVAMIIGFFPPASINVGGLWHYEMMFCGGTVLMLSPVLLLFLYRRRSLKLNFTG